MFQLINVDQNRKLYCNKAETHCLLVVQIFPVEKLSSNNFRSQQKDIGFSFIALPILEIPNFVLLYLLFL